MASSYETIFANFTECPLAPLEDIPTYNYLTELNAYLNACSASVPSDLGCGTLGYLVLTTSPAVFAILCATPFIEPVHPGATPLIPDPLPPAAAIGVITREHAEDSRVFREYHNVDKACKKVITRLVPEIYYKSLKNRYTGFSGNSSLEILTHLWTEYGEISEDHVRSNDGALKREITGETHFETLVAQVEDHVEAVAIQNPYTPAQILTIAYNLVKDTGYYDDGCKEWKRKDATDKTWTNFKTFFAREFKELREASTKAKNGGFANNVEKTNDNDFMMIEMAQDHTEALANLATATKSDRDAVMHLSATNATLTAQLLELHAKQESSVMEITKLQVAAAKCKCGRKGPWQPSGISVGWDPKGYCWSHGFKCKVGHTSATCTTRKPNHKVDTTRDNIMGGFKTNQDWKK